LPDGSREKKCGELQDLKSRSFTFNHTSEAVSANDAYS